MHWRVQEVIPRRAIFVKMSTQQGLPTTPPIISGVITTTVGSAGTAILVIPWTDGKPSVKWDATANSEAAWHYCYCPLSTLDQLKIHRVTVKGLDRKFGANDPTYHLSALKSSVWKHLKNTGMDSVFYFFDKEASKMQEIISMHSRFMLSEVSDIIQEKKDPAFTVPYNGFDFKNLGASPKFLLDCLSDKL